MKKLKEALRKAVEMLYEAEMKHTAMDVLEIKEVGENTPYPPGVEETQTYSWNTREDWIEDRMEDLLA